MKLTIDMPWGKDLTHNQMRYGKGGGYRKKRHVQAWMIQLGWLLEMGKNAPPFFELEWQLPLKVSVDFRFPDKRRRDDHNYYKVICDAVASGLGVDDQHIRISTGSVTVDRERPGFTITVEDRQDD